jgi:hypothetical protein
MTYKVEFHMEGFYSIEDLEQQINCVKNNLIEKIKENCHYFKIDSTGYFFVSNDGDDYWIDIKNPIEEIKTFERILNELIEN